MRRLLALAIAAVAVAPPGGQARPQDQGQAAGREVRPAGLTGQMYVIGSIVAFEARTRVPMGVELRPFGSMPAPPASPGDRVRPLPVTPPVLAGGNFRVPATPPVIRQALDDFVAVNPGYEWAVNGPLIAVLPAGAAKDADDWLNAAVPSFDVHGATVREALVNLRRTLDPEYDEARVVAGRTPSAGPATTQTALQERVEQAQARRFDLTLGSARIRDVLDAIVLAHGEASWLVTFDGDRPVAPHGRVEVVFWQGSSMIAYPVVPHVRPPSTPTRTRAPRLLTVPFSRETLQFTLSGLATASRRPIGFRLGTECPAAGQPVPARLLNLEGLGLDEAADLALANCAGYERRLVDGVLNVGPAGNFGRDVVLDAGTRHFKVVDMPFRDTMWEVAKRLLRHDSVPRSRPVRGAPSDRAPSIALDQAKRVTVDVKNATLRAALNALVAAHGAAWWAIDGPSPQGLVRLTMGGSGWSESWTGAPNR